MKSILLISLGSISLGLGIVGILLPVLPTTPFLLLSLACFVNTNKKLYNFILKNRYLAPYVEDFTRGNGIPKKVKIRAILLIWFSIGISSIFFINQTLVRLLIWLIASIVSIYIWTRKSPKSESL